MKQNQPVVFRRVRGRIVPIRAKSQNSGKAAQGLAYIGAGLATGAAAGSAYRAINRLATATSSRSWKSLEKADKISFKARGTGQLDLEAYGRSVARKERVRKTAMQGLQKARRIQAVTPSFRLGGVFLASTLIGVGAAKLYEAGRGQKVTTEETTAVSGAIASAAFLTGAYRGAGFRLSIKPLYKKAYPHLRKLKGALKL